MDETDPGSSRASFPGGEPQEDGPSDQVMGESVIGSPLFQRQASAGSNAPEALLYSATSENSNQSMSMGNTSNFWPSPSREQSQDAQQVFFDVGSSFQQAANAPMELSSPATNEHAFAYLGHPPVQQQQQQQQPLATYDLASQNSLPPGPVPAAASYYFPSPSATHAPPHMQEPSMPYNSVFQGQQYSQDQAEYTALQQATTSAEPGQFVSESQGVGNMLPSQCGQTAEGLSSTKPSTDQQMEYKPSVPEGGGDNEGRLAEEEIAATTVADEGAGVSIPAGVSGQSTTQQQMTSSKTADGASIADNRGNAREIDKSGQSDGSNPEQQTRDLEDSEDMDISGGVVDEAHIQAEMPLADTGQQQQQQQVAETTAPAPPTSNAAAAVLPLDRHLAIRNIVMGSPSKSNAIPAAVPAAGTTAKKASSDASGPAKKKEKPKRKKPAKPSVRILISKKDSKQASELLRDKVDLASIIPSEDCFFLGRDFWIFTVEQLSSALKSPNTSSEGTSVDLREEIIAKLALDLGKQKVPGTTEEKRQPVSEGSGSQNGPLREGDKSSPVVTSTVSSGNSAEVQETQEKNPAHTDGQEVNAAPMSISKEEEVVVPEHVDHDAVAHSLSSTSFASTGSEKPSPSAGTEGVPTATAETTFSLQGPSPGSTGVAQAPGLAADSSVQQTTNNIRKMAEERVEKWARALEEVGTARDSETDIEQRFPLDGAIGTLFSTGSLNFLASVDVKTLWNFLALKKTETGAICELLQMWRRKCKLLEIPDISLAKHLLGVAYRIETAISAVPPVSSKEREWIRDPIVCFTGAARQFLVNSQGIVSAGKFTEMRTKDLSNALLEWRETRGLPPLKGSGKVAMISAWKTAAKEYVLAEAPNGEVIDLKSALQSPQIINREDVGPPVKQTRKRKSATSLNSSVSDRGFDYALHSKIFVEDCLGKDVAYLFQSSGIKTTAELFAADISADSDLFRLMKNAGKVESHATFGKLIDGYRTSLRHYLEEVRSNESNDVTAVAETKPTAEGEKKTRKRKKRNNKSSAVVPVKVHSMSSIGGSSDPFQALSEVTIRFLKSIGITTATEFLSSRTTDISEHFVHWRVAEGKPELKGLGAIASVSGWKAGVRKRAKELGLEELSILEPASKTRTSGGPRKSKREPSRKAVKAEEDDFLANQNFDEAIETQGSLSEEGRKLIAVQSRDSNGQFVFELSIRKRAPGCSSSVFATYKGFSRGLPSTEPAQTIELQYEGAESGSNMHTTNWVLAAVPVTRKATPKFSLVDSRSPFSVDRTGCGLVEIGAYGARPTHKQDLYSLKNEIQSFVLNGVHGQDLKTNSVNAEGNYNVLINKVGLDNFHYLLRLTTPIESGQTVALRFPSVGDALQSKKYDSTENRTMHVIDEATRTLCLEDLQTLLVWLRDDVLPSTGYEESLQDGSTVSFKDACERRRRLFWVSRRIASAIGKERLSPEITEASKSLYFGGGSLQNEDRQRKVLSSVLAEQIKEEMKYVLELDSVCGVTPRAEWRPKTVELLGAILMCASEAYASVRESGQSLSSLMEISVNDLLKGIDFNNNAGFQQESNDTSKPPPTEGSSQDKVELYEAKSADDIQKEIENPSAQQFRQLLWQITSLVMRAFTCNLDEAEEFDCERLLSAVRPHVLGVSAVPDETVVISYKSIRSNASSFIADHVPGSYPFFLGIVWPALRKLGWSLDAGDTPSDVSFSPIPKSQQQIGLLKHERDSKRLKLAKEVNNIGLGVVPKTTKRLLAAVSGQEEICGPKPPGPSETQPLTVEDILSRFRAWLQTKVANEEEQMRSAYDEKIKQILRTIEDCFDACAPMLSSLDVALCPPSLKEGQRPIAAYGCEYLMQFLLILPSVLSQAELTSEQTTDCEEIARELLAFITDNYKDLLDKRFHPPQEKYVNQGMQSETSFIDSRVGSLIFKERKRDTSSHSGNGQVVVMKDLVLEEDKAGITDFLVTVLEQAMPYRATAEDVRMKGQRIYEGFPGVVCRHCKGAGGHGKYFFRSLESLSTCYTVLEAHCLKCAPEEVKKNVRSARLRHQEQRKVLRTGSQQAFFNRLWDRLQTGKIAGQSSISVREPTTEADVPITGKPPASIEFTDHIRVLDYIRSGNFKTNRELEEALDKYYSCLDYGGRVNNTPSMPEHFSSVWLLAKVLPKHVHHNSYQNVG